MSLRAKEKALSDDETEKPQDDNIVIRNGKKYRRVKADEVEWANKIF